MLDEKSKNIVTRHYSGIYRCSTYTYAKSPPRDTISLYFREMQVRAEQVRK